MQEREKKKEKRSKYRLEYNTCLLTRETNTCHLLAFSTCGLKLSAAEHLQLWHSLTQITAWHIRRAVAACHMIIAWDLELWILQGLPSCTAEGQQLVCHSCTGGLSVSRAPERAWAQRQPLLSHHWHPGTPFLARARGAAQQPWTYITKSDATGLQKHSCLLFCSISQGKKEGIVLVGLLKLCRWGEKSKQD